MNDQRLARVLDNVEETIVPEAFAPGAGGLLVAAPSLEEKAVQARNAIVESAAQLVANMTAAYRERAEEAQRRLERIQELGEKLLANATRTAEEVEKLNTRDRAIDDGVNRVLAEHGVSFDGKL